MRKIRTASGAVAVQIVTRKGRAIERIEHVGSTYSDGELALLLACARERLAPGQEAPDLGEALAVPARMDEIGDWTGGRGAPGGQRALELADGRRGPRPPAGVGGQVVATSSLVLWQVLTRAYARLGFDELADEAFRVMALSRIVEPTSKTDSLRVLAEVGAPCPSVRTLYRSLRRCQAGGYRDRPAKACAARSSSAGGLSAMVMYDCTTLHFEISDEDADARQGSKPLRKVGMSKEHRVDPQVQVGLLVDPSRFPLEVHLFEGNTAETTTILPVLRKFQERHGVTGMIVVVDVGMLSANNLHEIEDAGFSFIVGSRPAQGRCVVS